jgi:hypothetical protein
MTGAPAPPPAPLAPASEALPELPPPATGALPAAPPATAFDPALALLAPPLAEPLTAPALPAVAGVGVGLASFDVPQPAANKSENTALFSLAIGMAWLLRG